MLWNQTRFACWIGLLAVLGQAAAVPPPDPRAAATTPRAGDGAPAAAHPSPAQRARVAPVMIGENPADVRPLLARWGLEPSDLSLLSGAALLRKAGLPGRAHEVAAAGASGDPVALYLHGMQQRASGNAKDASEPIARAAGLGLVRAISDTSAGAYLWDESAGQSALESLRRAAGTGNAASAYFLGEALLTGNMGSGSADKQWIADATRSFTYAAEAGFAPAQLRLARMIYNSIDRGSPNPALEATAKLLLDSAVAQGDAAAIEFAESRSPRARPGQADSGVQQGPSPDASPSPQRTQPGRSPDPTALERKWGAYAHIADQGGWWREARGSFWNYRWHDAGEQLEITQYDAQGKVAHSQKLRIEGDLLLTDKGHRTVLPDRSRLKFGDTQLSPDLQRMWSAYEHGGRAYRYDYVRSTRAEFDAAVRSAAGAQPAARAAPARSATVAPAAHASRPVAPACPATLAALSQALTGRKLISSKKETPFVQASGLTLMPQDGEDLYDPAGWSFLGVAPLRVLVTIHAGKPKSLWADLPGHDLKPYEAAFRAQFTGRGSMRCDAKECRWTLVPYPQKAPKGMLGEASISLYNLTTTKTTLNCRYGE